MPITINPKKSSGGSGSVTGAESGTGIVSGKVRLGINPLLQATVIDANFNQFEVVGQAGNPLTAIFQIVGGTVMNMGILGRAQLLFGSGNGIGVSDPLDHFGLVGDENFLNRVTPLQYIQQINVPYYVGLVNSAIISAPGDNNFTIYHVTNNRNELLRISLYLNLLALAGGGNVDLSINWTDSTGLPTGSQVAGFSTFPDQQISQDFVIYAQKNTNVVITVTNNIAGNQSKLYARCEYLGVSNNVL